MIDAFTHVSWLAVVIATVVTTALGGVYFVALVPQHYLRVLGRTEAPKPTPVAMVGPLVCGFVIVLASAVLIAALDLDTIGDAIVFGLVVGIGYLMAMTFQIALNPNFPHPIRYGLLNTPYFLTCSLATSVIMVVV